MIRKKFLVLMSSIIFLLLLGASFFYFCWSKDNLIKFIPENTVFYAHFDFNIYHWSGKRANVFFQNKWPDKFFRQIGFEEYWSLFECNLDPQILPGIQELAFLVVEDETKNRFHPLILYKFQSAFADMPFVFCNNESKINVSFLDKNKQIALLRLGDEDLILKKSTDKFFTKKINLKNFFAPPFLRGFFKYNFLSKQIFGNHLNYLENFLAQPQSKFLPFDAKIYKQKIYFWTELQSQNTFQSKNINHNFFQQSLKFIMPEANFVFWNFDFKNTKNRILLIDLLDEQLVSILKNQNNLLINSQDNLLFVFPRAHEQESEESELALSQEKILNNLENQIRQKLSYFFPQELVRVLPDKTKVIELIADPKIFHFLVKSLANFEVHSIKITKDVPPIAVAINKDFILLSNNLNFLEEVINHYSEKREESLEIKNFLASLILKEQPQEVFWQVLSIQEFGNIFFMSQNTDQKMVIQGLIF